MTNYVVWNENKTANFATADKQLAYEVRKGASSNCYNKEGIFCDMAAEFAEKYGAENCTIEIGE